MNYGKPCTGCGDCCNAVSCGLSYALFQKPEGSDFLCPALEEVEGKFRCGLVLHPQQYVDLGPKAAWRDRWFGDYIGQMLGIGKGCDSATAQQQMVRDAREWGREAVAELRRNPC